MKKIAKFNLIGVIFLENKRGFSFKKYWGPDELAPHVTFSRNGVHYCVYCGEESDTREHAPSKVFLQKPYPSDLPVLPACYKCNNGFSDDELYVEVYIDSLKYLSGYSSCLREENNDRIKSNAAFWDAQYDLHKFYQGENISINPKIERILTKLAVCHMVYELSDGYSTNNCCIQPKLVSYYFSFDMTKSEIDAFDEFVLMNDKQTPTIGSRVFDKVYVLEPALNNIDETEINKIRMIVMSWTNIQEQNYRYIAWLENDDTFHIKIVIHDFLYAEIIFDQSQ